LGWNTNLKIRWIILFLNDSIQDFINVFYIHKNVGNPVGQFQKRQDKLLFHYFAFVKMDGIGTITSTANQTPDLKNE
jgi:hypothetical protein